MAKLFVYDAFNNRFYTYDLNENDPMPYSYGSTLKLREFRGSSGANVLWTTTAAMEAWNLTRRHPGRLRLQTHLGGWPRHHQPALRGCGL